MGDCWSQVEEAGECIQGALCCLMCLPCIGLILTIVGIVVLTSIGDDSRITKIDAWNDAKLNWNEEFATTFSYSDLTVDVSRGGVGVASDQQLVLNTQADPINDQRKDGDPEWFAYDPAKYQSSPITVSGLSLNPITINYTISMGNRTMWRVEVPSVTESSKSSSSLKCYTSRTSNRCRRRGESSSRKYCRCDDACYDSDGTWSGSSIYRGTCTYTHALTEVCIRTDATGKIDRTTRSATDEGGCHYTNDRWSLGLYSNSKSTSLSSVSVPVVVRSTHDPFVELNDVTKGSLEFGLSDGEKVQVGILLLVFGLICLICPCCVGAGVYFCMSNNGSVVGARV